MRLHVLDIYLSRALVGALHNLHSSTKILSICALIATKTPRELAMCLPRIVFQPCKYIVIR